MVAQDPNLALMKLTVPANSLYSDDGKRGGEVGIALVPSDRLPSPLPPGLEHDFDITVQSDGALNFDTPAPVCFPNLPDPLSGEVDPPGAKRALVSFNHKTGEWEPVGYMTVSDDGAQICSDPGTGVLQPGWHFPPTPPDPGDPPDCDDCDCEECEPPDAFDRLGANNGCLADCDAKAQRWMLASAALLLQGARASSSNSWMMLLAGSGAVAAIPDLIEGDCAQGCPTPRAALGMSSASSADLFSLQPAPGGLVSLPGAGAQIAQLAHQAAALALPYRLAGRAVPSTVQSELDALLDQADSLAGGDALAFLRGEQLALEESLQRDDPQRGWIRGNSPLYPVRYAAIIEKGTNILVFRGEAAPQGRYNIFTPRGAVLRAVWFYDNRTQRYGVTFPVASAASLPVGAVRPGIPRLSLVPVRPGVGDSDEDGLPDVAEFVYGSSLANPDTDGDGVSDGAAVLLGRSPLGSRETRMGVVSVTQTPGPAVDVAVHDEIAVTADLDKGISVFNVFNGLPPTLVAQVETPGITRSVSFSGPLVAVADDTAGLVVVDIRAPAQARIVQQVPLSTPALAVVAVGETAFVGTADGLVEEVDMSTGLVLQRLAVGSRVHDLSAVFGRLFVLTETELLSFSVKDQVLEPLGAVATSALVADAFSGRKRLHVGTRYALASCYAGYDLFDVANPAAMARIGAAQITTVASFKQIVDNGAGVGIAAVGNNPSGDGTHDVQLFDLSTPSVTTNLSATLPTSGAAYAVALYHGQAYVADGNSGLALVNYLAPDIGRTAPQVALAATFSLTPPQVEEQSAATIRANASDDIQVRQVEFYVDDIKSWTSGAYPFEYSFVTPARTPARTTFRLRLRAIDTAGNSTWSEESTVALLTNTTPPRVLLVDPRPGRKLAPSTVTNLTVLFGRPIDSATLTTNTFQLFVAGADAQPGTADDTRVNGAIFSQDAAGRAFRLNPAQPLPAGQYRAVITAGVKDRIGRPLASDYAWAFEVPLTDLQVEAAVAGAGQLDYPDDQDVYSFLADPGQRLYFDAQSGDNCSSALRWRCQDEMGAVLFDQLFGAFGFCGPGDPGTLTLTNGGRYSVTVYRRGGAAASYRFQIFNVVPQPFGISIGDVIGSGSPASGAGNIETPGALDVYTFQAAAGQQVYFDSQSGDNCALRLRWRCVDGQGSVLFDQLLGASGPCGPGDRGTVTLTQGGSYTLTVYGVADETGAYQFQLQAR